MRVQFEISGFGFEMGFCPISDSPVLSDGFLRYVNALCEEGNLRTSPLPNSQKLKVVMISVVRLLASDRNVPGKPPESAFERPNSGELMLPMIGPGFV